MASESLTPQAAAAARTGAYSSSVIAAPRTRAAVSVRRFTAEYVAGVRVG